MEKIESVLCIKFIKPVFSNAYDKTELVYHATKPQRKEDGSKQHCKLILSERKPLPKFKLPQFLHKNDKILQMTNINGTINLQSLFCRRDFFFQFAWCEFIWFTVFSSGLLCFSVFCFCLKLIFCPSCFVVNQNKTKVLFCTG